MLEAFTKTSPSPYLPLNRTGCWVLSFTQKSFSEGTELQTNEDYYLRRIDNNKTKSSQFLSQILVRPRRSGTMSKLRRSIIFQCCNEYSDSDSDSNLFLRIPNIRIRIRDFCKTNNIQIRICNRILTSESESF